MNKCVCCRMECPLSICTTMVYLGLEVDQIPNFQRIFHIDFYLSYTRLHSHQHGDVFLLLYIFTSMSCHEPSCQKDHAGTDGEKQTPKEKYKENYKGKSIGARWIKDTMRIWPTESTQQGSKWTKETEVTISESVWVLVKSSAYMLWL